MITPPYLHKGDKITIIAPARKIDKTCIDITIEMFNKFGIIIELSKNLFNNYNQFSGTIDERAEDLQNCLNNNEIKGILCARGGYGSVQIIDKIDFTNFIKNPKWLIGFSDITVFHSHINKQFEIETLHASMPINLCNNNYHSNNFISLINALTGQLLYYDFKSHPLNINGNATGKLVGGNLSILYSLIGSNSDIDTNGKILFIEDIDEYLYHIDRMMMNLKRSGKLKNLNGLIVGSMTDMKDNEIPYGENAYEIIYRIVKEYNYPVCFNFPAGHGYQNNALILGREINLTVQHNSCNITFKNNN